MSESTTVQASPITVERTPASQYYAERATVLVYFPGDPHPARVEVYGPERRFGEVTAARVNWSAVGSQSADVAILYASAIALAASIAPTLAPSTEA